MIEIHRSKNKQFFVRTRADNGKIINASETIKTMQGAKKNIRSNAKQFLGQKAFLPIKVKDFTSGSPRIIYV